MVYRVIGLMSGSSLDGLDICYAQYEEVRGAWTAQILKAECLSYSPEWTAQLAQAAHISVPDFLRLNSAYGRYLGRAVQDFMLRNELEHKVHFIASHGHTVFHDPAAPSTFQLGEGAAIAATCGLPVISDLRSMDVALGGQGAPIVPIGDKLLFGAYEALLNIGGIANLTIRQGDGTYLAFDVTVANQALNALAQKMGADFDRDGQWAAEGTLLPEALALLNTADYLQVAAPKSLSNPQAMALVQDVVSNEAYALKDRLNTLCHYVAQQVALSLDRYLPPSTEQRSVLLSGGGALNAFLVHLLREQLAQRSIAVVLPDTELIQYKEALVMGLIGVLRWREEVNVLASATGAGRDSVGGALWMGQ